MVSRKGERRIRNDRIKHDKIITRTKAENKKGEKKMQTGRVWEDGEGERRAAKIVKKGAIALPELPEIYGVYFADRKEMKRNTSAAPGSKIIVLHFKGK